MRLGLVAALVLVFGHAAPVLAQCPDGTPPPCGRAARPAGNSLAVLPFESVGGDTANIYFAQGLADELTTALSRVPGLRVAASSSAFTFGSGGADAQRVGRALRVGRVLEGRVRREGSRLRVVARLIDTQNGLLLWSNSYERELRDVFAVQDELTRDIVAALRATLTGGRGAPPPPAPSSAAPISAPATVPAAGRRPATRSLEAYDLYLRGRFLLVRRGPGVERSIPYFQQALAIDSTYARAWAQLGTAWALLPLFSQVSGDSAMPRARAAYERALRIDRYGAEGYTAQGFERMFANDLPGATAAFQHAIALDSSYPEPHRGLIGTLGALGRTTEAVAQGRRALALDPVNAITASVFSNVLLAARLSDEAVTVARRAVELDSTAAMAWSNLAVAELVAGHPDLAAAAVRRAAWIPNTTVPIAYVIGAIASRDSVEALLRRLEQEQGRNSSAPLAITFAWLGAGDTTRALDALQRAAEARAPVAFWSIFSHPACDPIRSSARFAAVVRSYGIDPRLFQGTAP